MFVSPSDFSLASGLGGKILYQIEESLVSPTPQILGELTLNLKNLLKNPRQDLSLFFGEAGDLWLLHQFLKHHQSPLWETQLSVRYENLKVRAQKLLSLPGRSELIRGAIGIGVLARAMGDEEFLEHILTYLESQAPDFFRLVDTGDVTTEAGTLSDKTDLGFAHGISGVLAFLVSYVGGAEEQRARALAEKIFLTLSLHVTPDGLLPKYLPEGEASWHQGWCYGNLSTAYAIELTTSTWPMKNSSVMIETLSASAKKYFSNSEREFPDSLCHGRASLNLLCEQMDTGWRLPLREDRTEREVTNWAFLNGEIGVRLSLLRAGSSSKCGWEELLLLGRKK